MHLTIKLTIMNIEVTLNSRFMLDGCAIHFKYLAKVSHETLYERFKSNHKLILSEEALSLVTSMHHKIKRKILKIDNQRKEYILKKQQYETFLCIR